MPPGNSMRLSSLRVRAWSSRSAHSGWPIESGTSQTTLSVIVPGQRQLQHCPRESHSGQAVGLRATDWQVRSLRKKNAFLAGVGVRPLLFEEVRRWKQRQHQPTRAFNFAANLASSITVERFISDKRLFVNEQARRSSLTKIVVPDFVNAKTELWMSIKLALKSALKPHRPNFWAMGKFGRNLGAKSLFFVPK